jgi:regulator of CtrA degradation
MRRKPDTEPISFGRAFARSDTFRGLFRDGMTLVEEAANYLDGEGRTASRRLSRPAAIVYATESMRLTTRLMQLASWLLLHRSINEGHVSLAEAAEEKRKIRFDTLSTAMAGPGWDDLPEPFRSLVARSLALQTRVGRIEAALRADRWVDDAANPVGDSIEALAAAFGARTRG